MRKLYLTSIFIVCVIITTSAQFLMKSNTHMLRTGDEHYFNISNNVDPGVSGSSIVWDYSNLKDKSTLTSYMYSAYTSPYFVDITEVNAILEEYETMFYFKVSEGLIEHYGTVTANNTLTKYNKPFVKMIFPFNYGDTYSGDFSGTIEGANNYKTNFTGTYTLEADAYGTLILPRNIVYKNVLRIKTIKEQCFNTIPCNCSTISYKWYSEDVRYPLLTIIQNQTSKETKTIRTAYYSKTENQVFENKSSKNAISESIDAKIYPNPFMDDFKLDYNITNDADVLIEIYDNTGKKLCSIQKLNQKAGYYIETINSDKIGNQLGMFHIRIILGDDVVSKTVIRSE